MAPKGRPSGGGGATPGGWGTLPSPPSHLLAGLRRNQKVDGWEWTSLKVSPASRLSARFSAPGLLQERRYLARFALFSGVTSGRSRHALETCERLRRVWRRWRLPLGEGASGCGLLPTRVKGLELGGAVELGSLSLDDTVLRRKCSLHVCRRPLRDLVGLGGQFASVLSSGPGGTCLWAFPPPRLGPLSTGDPAPATWRRLKGPDLSVTSPEWTSRRALLPLGRLPAVKRNARGRVQTGAPARSGPGASVPSGRRSEQYCH